MRLAATREPWWYGRERTGSPLLAYVSAHRVGRHTAIPPHRTPAHKLAIVVHGSCDLDVDGRPIHLAGGTCVLIPTGAVLAGGPGPNAGLFLWIGLAPERDGQGGPALLGDEDRVRLSTRFAQVHGQVRPAGPDLVSAASAVFSAVHGRSPLILRHGLTLCLLARLDAALGVDPPVAADDSLRRAEALLAARPDGSLRVADLAAACGLGATAFTARCRALTGLTPLAWINRHRVTAATAALSAGDAADAVVRRFGYPDLRHLRRAQRALGLR
jgi:AraC-like DNA-binding protein